MKRSEAYKLAQLAVVNSLSLCPVDKLEVLKELMSQENIAKFCEEQEKGENNNA